MISLLNTYFSSFTLSSIAHLQSVAPSQVRVSDENRERIIAAAKKEENSHIDKKKEKEKEKERDNRDKGSFDHVNIPQQSTDTVVLQISVPPIASPSPNLVTNMQRL